MSTRSATFALAVASLLALPAPTLLVVLAVGSASRAESLFRLGEGRAWAVALVYVLTVGALVALGIGRRASRGSFLFGAALLPFLAGVASAVRGHFILHRFIEGQDLGARRAARMYLEGTRASESTLMIGAAMTACAMLLVGLVGLLRVRAALMAIASASAVLFASLAMYGIAKGRALDALAAYSVGAVGDAQRTQDLARALASMRLVPRVPLGLAGLRASRPDSATAAAGLELTNSREKWDDPAPQPILYVTADGTVSPSAEAIERAVAPEAFDYYNGKVGIVADRRTTYAALKAAVVPAQKRVIVFSLYLAPNPAGRPDLAPLGELATFFDRAAVSTDVLFLASSTSASELIVRLDGPTARVWRTPDVDETVPTGMDSRAVAFRRALFAKVVSPDYPLRIAPRDNDTLESIWQIVDDARSATTRTFAVSFIDDRRVPEELTRSSLVPWMVDDGAIGDSLFAPVPDGSHRTLREGFVAVNGRLPPGIIKRIVRQNFARFRSCFEAGEKTTPGLRGRVAVKLVIDRTGAVARAVNGDSDLSDKAVVDCVVKGFANLSFPPPEGGVVNVVYPFIYAPPEK